MSLCLKIEKGKRLKEMNSPKTVLIIDDDENIREMMRDFLQSHGYNVLLADDGLKGMDMIREEMVDLVILDVKLPYISGIGLAEIAGQTKPDLPIICITGHGDTAKNIALEKVCNVFSKPFELKEMLQAVKKQLD